MMHEKMSFKQYSRRPSYGVLCCAAMFVLIFVSADMFAGLRLPKIFGNGMVLQREKPIPVWGWASPLEKVTVTLDGKSVETSADSKGRWSTQLPAMSAGGPFELKVISGGENVLFSDVLIGEVWLCSGQSNMTVPVIEALNPDKEVAAANCPQVRYFHIGYNMDHIANRPLDDLQSTYSWEPFVGEKIKNMSAIASYFGRDLHKALKVPVGIIQASWGGTGIMSWEPMAALKNDPRALPVMAQWDAQWKEYRKTNDPAKNPNRGDNFNNAIHQPCGLFNGSIAPVSPYGIRGIIWYQGETDAGQPQFYHDLLVRLIRGWRKEWNDKKLPFIFVQLAAFGQPSDGTTEDGWADLREAQAKTLSEPNTAMVMALDTGEVENIHPKNKQEVAKRLALAAMAEVYGDKKAVYSGPVMFNAKKNGAKVIVEFANGADKLTIRGDKHVIGFVLAGQDGKFYPAEARISGNSVTVFCSKVSSPVSIRYAWGQNPKCNLFNTAGLPARPFRVTLGAKR